MPDIADRQPRVGADAPPAPQPAPGDRVRRFAGRRQGARRGGRPAAGRQSSIDVVYVAHVPAADKTAELDPRVRVKIEHEFDGRLSAGRK